MRRRLCRRWPAKKNRGPFSPTLLLGAVLTLLAFRVALPAGVSQVNPIVVLVTEAGSITLEIDVEHAPITAKNFLRYVDDGFFDGGEFHRTVRPDTEPRKDVPIEVVQARMNPARAKEGFEPIPLERTSVTGLKHLSGTFSMARDVTPTRPGPDTATSDVFICIRDEPELDFGGRRSPDGQGFAAFGRVISGMEVVKKIHMSPVSRSSPATKLAAAGQTLAPPIKIVRAHRQ